MKSGSKHKKVIGLVHALGAASTAGLMALAPTARAIAADPQPVPASAAQNPEAVPAYTSAVASNQPAAGDTGAADAPAADAAAPDTTASGTSGQLAEITVFAQRVAQNLQKVPIVVDTVTAEQAQNRGVTNIQSLFSTIPNLTFATASYGTNTYIRGVGDNSASPNNEPSTAVYIDGVYYAQSQALTSFDFNNIQQIAVLKGPQGTLFGRNSTAGVIQITTPDPQQQLGGRVEAGYGNYDTLNGEGYLTGGLTDKLAANVSVLAMDQMDGFGRDLTNGTPTYLQKNVAIRTKWLYDLSAATQYRLEADYADFASGGTPDQFVPVSAGLGPTTTPKASYNHGPFAGWYNVYGNPDHDDNMQYGAALTVDHDFGSVAHGQSISSYRYVTGYQVIDSDQTALNLNEINEHFDAHYVTQEFHLNNQNPGRFNWLVGAFYYGSQVFGSDPRIQYGSQLKNGYVAYHGVQDASSGSVFGQATAEIVDQTKLTLGMRYTYETLKDFSQTDSEAGLTTAGPFAQKIKSDPLTWRAALDHQFTSDIMGYASYNRGFKSGGFNLSSPGSAPFFPEYVDAYEMGLKSEFLDHRVRLNLAGFYYHYRDIQVAIVLGGNQLFQNAAAARLYGLDESLDFVVTDHFTLSTGLGLLSAKYQDYPNARGYTPAGAAFPIANAAGASLPFAPPATGFVSADYHDLMTPVGKLGATVNLSYNDRSFVSPDMGLERPTYFMLNATVEWRALSDDSWSVRLWGKNLTNAIYYPFASESATGWYVSLGQPRTYGITAEKDF